MNALGMVFAVLIHTVAVVVLGVSAWNHSWAGVSVGLGVWLLLVVGGIFQYLEERRARQTGWPPGWVPLAHAVARRGCPHGEHDAVDGQCVLCGEPV